MEKRPDVQVIADWDLTPARAAQLMTANRNRSLRAKIVQTYARDMTAGKWRDHSVIKVAWNETEGEIFIDGQHRAAAVIHSGVTIKVVLIKNLDPADQEVTDTGLRRKLSDTLKLRGVPNYNVVAAAVGWYWRRQNKLFISEYSPSISEGIAVLEEHPALNILPANVVEACRGLRVSLGMGVCFYYEMSLIDKDTADLFWEKLRYGEDLEEGHPILQLRARLTANAIDRTHKLDRYMIAALIIKAWNCFVTGERKSDLRWRRVGPGAEKFPVLQAVVE
jgi:hypothetical protein